MGGEISSEKNISKRKNMNLIDIDLVRKISIKKILLKISIRKRLRMNNLALCIFI